MTEPTEQDREKARQIVLGYAVRGDLESRVAQALADARDSQREADAQKVEDRAKACEANGEKYPNYAAQWYGVAHQIRQLASTIRQQGASEK